MNTTKEAPGVERLIRRVTEYLAGCEECDFGELKHLNLLRECVHALRQQHGAVATHDDISRCPKCDSNKTCFHCECCGENF